MKEVWRHPSDTDTNRDYYIEENDLRRKALLGYLTGGKLETPNATDDIEAELFELDQLIRARRFSIRENARDNYIERHYTEYRAWLDEEG